MKTIYWLITLLFILPIVASAETSVELLRKRLQFPAVGGHQGLMSLKPFSDTLGAFEKARRDGVDIVEMDLHISKDGVPVIYHDDQLDRWTDCKGKVQDKNLDELKKCQFNTDKSAKIPTFEEVLQWSQGRVVVNAEFKEDNSIEPAIRLVEKYNALSWTYFQTKNSRQKYLKARKANETVALLYVIDNRAELDWVFSLNDPALLVIELHPQVRTEEIISLIHTAGKLSSENSWHFSKSNELFGATCTELFKLKIDIAISNRPKSCLQQKKNF